MPGSRSCSSRRGSLFSSWPGLARPSTTCFRNGKDVDARHKAGHDGARSPLRQLQLNATVTAVGILALPGIERLKLAETGCDEALRRDAPADQVLHHRNGARG